MTYLSTYWLLLSLLLILLSWPQSLQDHTLGISQARSEAGPSHSAWHLDVPRSLSDHPTILQTLSEKNSICLRRSFSSFVII